MSVEEAYRRITQRVTQVSHNVVPRLMVVSKRQSATTIESVIQAGAREFGENRLQEAQLKWPDLRHRYPEVKVYFIGSLQSNKLLDIYHFFDGVHSLYKEKHLEILARSGCVARHVKELLVEVNIGEEPQKAGIFPDALDDFLQRARELNIPISGLMAIPPQQGDRARYFQRLHHLAQLHQLQEVSMGMSQDFEIAIQQGATIVRIGTALWEAVL